MFFKRRETNKDTHNQQSYHSDMFMPPPYNHGEQKLQQK
jgi:hypothetical protein